MSAACIPNRSADPAYVEKAFQAFCNDASSLRSLASFLSRMPNVLRHVAAQLWRSVI
ncbi:hypothetical protein D3C86_1980210 [compost metagenome]